LFPYSPVVNYVNHNSTPNARVQWSASPGHMDMQDSSNSEWLNRSPAELIRGPYVGMRMELVALRDIQKNEEVFIDYGDAWTKNWQEFERGWSPHKKAKCYSPAWLLNKRRQWIITDDDRKEKEVKDKLTNPYKNVYTACFVGNTLTEVPKSDADDSIEHPMFRWTYSDGIMQDFDHLLPCEILELNFGNLQENDDEIMDRQESVVPLEMHYHVQVQRKEDTSPSILLYVPRDAVIFLDKPYSTDMFLANAFRHEIQLPNEMIPPAWRDLETK
jgi:SET domain